MAIRSERLNGARLLAFTSPVILFQAIELAWRTYLPSFLATTLALPVATAGMLLFAARLFDGFIDPAIGFASDRWRTRFGLRRPWLVLGAPLVSLGALGVFWARPGTSFASLAAASMTLHLGYMLIATPHGGWGLELSRDPHERVRVMGAKVWVAMAGSIATLLLPSLLERTLGLGRAAQVGALGAAIALLAPLVVLLAIRAVAEPDVVGTTRVANPLRQFAAMLRDPPMRGIMILYGLIGLADAASAGTFLFFVEQALGLKGWGSTLLLVQGIVPLATLPLWARLSRHHGKRRTLRLAYGWLAAVVPFVLLLPAGGLLPLIAWLVARNLGAGVDYMLLRAMVSDLTREEVDHGQRWSASRYALFNVTLRLAMGAGVAGALGLLGAAGFAPDRPVSEPLAMVVRLVHAGPTAIVAVVVCLMLSTRPAQARRQPEQAALPALQL